ncbi:hypothetical protein IV102_14055 [bacterium]|nr:hypothetical protein [bacterium]
MTTRLNVSLDEDEMALLKGVVPSRGLSSFVKEAALARAREVQRERLRKQIVEAYEADPEYQREAGRAWDEVAHTGWDEP